MEVMIVKVGDKSTQRVEPEDVAAMMSLLKIARVATGHGKADNWIDLAGYAACGGEIEGGRHDEEE